MKVLFVCEPHAPIPPLPLHLSKLSCITVSVFVVGSAGLVFVRNLNDTVPSLLHLMSVRPWFSMKVPSVFWL